MCNKTLFSNYLFCSLSKLLKCVHFLVEKIVLNLNKQKQNKQIPKQTSQNIWNESSKHVNRNIFK